MCINYVAVCVFAGVHNDAKSIQCHWRVKGGCSTMHWREEVHVTPRAINIRTTK